MRHPRSRTSQSKDIANPASHRCRPCRAAESVDFRVGSSSTDKAVDDESAEPPWPTDRCTAADDAIGITWGVFAPTFRRDAIATSPSASARTSTVRATWSNGSSIGSNSVGGSRRATTNPRPTTWPSFSSHQYGCGFVLMSPRPSITVAFSFDF